MIIVCIKYANELHTNLLLSLNLLLMFAKKKREIPYVSFIHLFGVLNVEQHYYNTQISLIFV